MDLDPPRDKDQHFEQPAWVPAGVQPLGAPIDRQHVQDPRWRPSRGPQDLPGESKARTWKAISDQCRFSRIPGYTGFIPSARAEDVYGRTQAGVGERALYEQTRRDRMRSSSVPGGSQSGLNSAAGRRAIPAPEMGSMGAGDEHPLGRSQCVVQRGHWVPTIPGYSGYIPGKHAENICGGGIIPTCQMAGRAIAERSGLPEPASPVMAEDGASRSRFAEHFHARNVGVPDGQQPSPEKMRLAYSIREHCDRQIPGYSGHVPRIHGESICGATARSANLLAAEMAEDKIFNPERHARACCAPQAPAGRKLRA